MKNIPDFVMARHYRALNGPEPLPSVSYALADPNNYPPERRYIEDGIVTALRETNGDILKKTVCPYCHFPLSDASVPTLTVIFWQDSAPSHILARRFIAALHCDRIHWQAFEAEPDPFNEAASTLRALAANVELSYPMRACSTADDTDGAANLMFRKLQTQALETAQAAVICVQLEAPNESVPLADDSADYVIEQYLLACFQSETLKSDRPTVILVQLDESESYNSINLQGFVPWLQKTHSNFLGRLYSRIPKENCLILPYMMDEPAVAVYAAAQLVRMAGISLPPDFDKPDKLMPTEEIPIQSAQKPEFLIWPASISPYILPTKSEETAQHNPVSKPQKDASTSDAGIPSASDGEPKEAAAVSAPAADTKSAPKTEPVPTSASAPGGEPQEAAASVPTADTKPAPKTEPVPTSTSAPDEFGTVDDNLLAQLQAMLSGETPSAGSESAPSPAPTVSEASNDLTAQLQAMMPDTTAEPEPDNPTVDSDLLSQLQAILSGEEHDT